jgi:hypothetical protein
LEEWRGEDGIVGVHGLKDVIARGSEEDTDRGDGAGGSHLEDATDKAHFGVVRMTKGRRGGRRRRRRRGGKDGRIERKQLSGRGEVVRRKPRRRPDRRLAPSRGLGQDAE